MARPTARCAATKSSSTSIGRRRAAPRPPTIMALAIDHRAQLEKIADDAGSPRERISDFKLLAVEAAAKSRPAAPASACCSTAGTAARLCSAPSTQLLDRPAGRGARLPPARVRVRRLARRQARRMAGRPYDQVPVLLPPRRSAGDEGAAGARASAPLRRRAHARARTADRDHREQERAGRRSHDRPRDRAAL